MENHDHGILFAWNVNPAGSTALEAGDVEKWRPGDGTLWVHLDRTHVETRDWLESGAQLDPFVVDALLEEETRPRVLAHAAGVLVNLRGVNLNPGASPEDMVSVRMWIDADRLISLRGPALMAAEDVSRDLARGEGPRTPGGLLVSLADALLSRMGPVVNDIDEVLDQFEQDITDDDSPDPPAARISAVRRRAIALRRYLAPQREVLVQLAESDALSLTSEDRRELRQNADRVTRLVESLDAVRERGAVTHEEVSERLSLRMNRNMYLLSVVAAVFLPLSFITGLLGINVAGMPGAATDWAFWAVCIALAILLAVELWLLRRRDWLD